MKAKILFVLCLLSGLMYILAGILLTNITMAPSGLPIVAVLIAIELWVIADNWEKYLPMVKA